MLVKSFGGLWRGFGSMGPSGLYTMSEAGLFFDFSDPRTLTTDAAGATPLTAPGQTIGLVADKSRIRAPITSYAGVQASAGLRPAWGRGPKSRRNQIDISEDFANAYWTKTGVVTTAVAPGPFSGMVADRLDSGYVHAIENFGAVLVTQSVYVKPDGASSVSILVGDSTRGTFTFATMLATGSVEFEALSNGWYRVWANYTPLAGNRTYRVTTVDGAVFLSGFQIETGATPTFYQKATSAFDLTETGFPSFGYTRLDGADDKLTVTLPGAITGDLMIFGRNGSWIETGVTLPSGAFDLGPTGTVLTPGVLRALGDLVGIVIIARTTTAAERALALRYFAARGAAGWLLAGAELITNGTFAVDASGWVSNNATLAVVGGELEFTATLSVHSVQRGVTVVPGTPYLFTFSGRRGTIAALKYSVYNATGLADIVPSTAYAADATMRPWQFVFIAPAGCVTANVYMARDSGSTGTAYFDNVSVKPLTVGA